MSEIRKDSADSAGFIGCDYKEITASGERASFYLDCYQNFGWLPDGREAGTKGKIVLRRERRIINKAELTRLQRNFEACMDEIAALEQSRTSAASVAALSVGLVGTAFIAGSTFAVVHEPPLVALTILLALPGFLGWILPWFLYRRMVFQRSKIVTELIERKYDEIYEICEKGSQLLNI